MTIDIGDACLAAKVAALFRSATIINHLVTSHHKCQLQDSQEEWPCGASSSQDYGYVLCIQSDTAFSPVRAHAGGERRRLIRYGTTYN